MTYSLAPFVYHAPIGCRVVILDVRLDRYLQLHGLAARAICEASSGREPERIAAAKLVALGIFQASGEVRKTAALPRLATSATESPPVRGGSVSLANVCATLASTTFTLKYRGLQAALENVAQASKLAAGAGGSAALAIASAQSFDAVRARMPIARRCLRDSICLHRLLARRGLEAQLVLGVRLDPFQAHAWVQAGDVLLSDRLDGVTPFTPIFVS